MSALAARAAAALRLDIRLQWRYGFFYAAAFSAVFWEVIVRLIPPGPRPAALPYLIFGDLGIVGYFFVAGAVFFERGERTLFAVLTSPLRFGEYLAGKVATLTALALALSLLVTFTAVGFDFSPLPMLVGTILCAVLFLLAGFISATPFRSISDWLIPSTAVIALLNVPLLHYSGLWHHPAMYAIPTLGTTQLLGVAFGQLSLEPWQYAYAVAYQLAWIAGLYLLARKTFDRYVVRGEGGA
ncbi:MAG TPA: fluoroquinolone transporter permease [Stackebrandtia sp.]|jgi:fluoroquinolone transport system permease protein|uniref:fluoroquinolone export ABC transporter permease subunit n=1 Tax=Stackebrandtia sp. TaxID=2023065 RepID=UPI002D269FF7|nr:fluoroquinolone transporter permease [Stackebrandtia sp.]HZE38178.1 fluoroquinolone transporter permease [Stackebrandtia sp.]